MEVIVIESEAYKQLMDRLDRLEKHFDHVARKQPLSENWYSLDETCEFLRVSKRSLQKYRDEGYIAFSKVGGKFYFKASDIETFLNQHKFTAFRKPNRF